MTVATDDCEEYYSKLSEKIQLQKKKFPHRKIFNIHFGVYSGSENFSLEIHGYNGKQLLFLIQKLFFF